MHRTASSRRLIGWWRGDLRHRTGPGCCPLRTRRRRHLSGARTRESGAENHPPRPR